MAITRTPIINDDGTCTTGTVWDNAWKTELYDQIDAVTIPATTVPAPMTIGPSWHGSVPAGQLNDWDLRSLGKYTSFVMSPIGNLLVTGIVSPGDGTVYVLYNWSTYTVTLGHYSGASAQANRFTGPGSADFAMGPMKSARILYDAALLTWLVL